MLHGSMQMGTSSILRESCSPLFHLMQLSHTGSKNVCSGALLQRASTTMGYGANGAAVLSPSCNGMLKCFSSGEQNTLQYEQPRMRTGIARGVVWVVQTPSPAAMPMVVI